VIVCIGDSVTYGQHLEHPDVPWPQLLNGYTVYSAGVPGDTTRLGLERFPKDVQAMKPTTVIIQFGHNDCNRWETDHGLPRVSPHAFVANLTEMIERSRLFGAQPYLCSLTPSHRSPEHHADVGEYDVLIRDVSRATATKLIDVRWHFLGREHEMLMTDGLHLSPEGHRLYAKTVLETLSPRVFA
jgi:lysophospholipase L1-like esterase